MEQSENINLKIPKELSSDLKSLISRFLEIKSINTNSNNYYPGEVRVNNDPQKLGRCRVLVYGKYDNIPDDSLPWAVPCFGLQGGFSIPEVGQIVKVFFNNNDFHNPFYDTKALNSNDLPDEKNDDYPNSQIVFSTPNGDYWKINKVRNEHVIHTASGMTIVIDQNGNMEVSTINTGTGTINIKSRGRVTLSAPSIELPSGNVIPTGRGPLLAQHFDTVTGLPMSGNVEYRS